MAALLGMSIDHIMKTACVQTITLLYIYTFASKN